MEDIEEKEYTQSDMDRLASEYKCKMNEMACKHQEEMKRIDDECCKLRKAIINIAKML